MAMASPCASPLPNAGWRGHARKTRAIMGAVPAWRQVTAGKKRMGVLPLSARKMAALARVETVINPAPNRSAKNPARLFPTAAAKASRTASSGGKIEDCPIDQANDRAAIARRISQPTTLPMSRWLITTAAVFSTSGSSNPRVIQGRRVRMSSIPPALICVISEATSLPSAMPSARPITPGAAKTPAANAFRCPSFQAVAPPARMVERGGDPGTENR